MLSASSLGTSPSPISYASYPHVVEDILAYSDYATQLVFRLACASLRDRADALLCGTSLSLPDGESDGRRLPYFSRASCGLPQNRTKQHRAVSRARLILLDGVDADAATNETLSHIHPDSSIVLNHERDAVVRLRLPEVEDLTILGSHQCCCDDVQAPGEEEPGEDGSDAGSEEDTRYAQRFAHAARSVHIDLTMHPEQDSSQHYHFRCALAMAALNQEVRCLTISVTEVFHLGMVLAPLQYRLSPQWRHEDFSVQIRFKGGRPEFDIQALLAGLLEMDGDRITVEDI